jgi:glycosyltransferase involved in cell wall biosynthesis
MNPLVSVIVPVYNGEPYLKDAIDSILKQTYQPIEIIVVDDGSTDRSKEVVKSFTAPIKYFFQSNSGTAAARNIGIHSAKGSFFAFLDQDDLWTENKLNLQIAAFNDNPNLDIAFGMVKQFHSPELDKSFKQSIQCPHFPMPGFLPSAMLVKREAFFKVGLFDSTWQIGEWANWYVRACELKLRIVMLPELVALRRLHDSNKGILQNKFRAEYIRILKASLDRQRLSKGETTN